MNIQPITSQKARALLSKHVSVLEKLPIHGNSKVLYKEDAELEVGNPSLQHYALLRNWRGIYEVQKNH